jgi:sirohydrochlorin ferrochelatase
MEPTLVIAAHGTAAPAGSATVRAIVEAVRDARPELPVTLCFLDVLAPSLSSVLDELDGDAVVLPLLLSAGYHVTTDIPSIVHGRRGVRVAGHLGPDPRIIEALADRLVEARGDVKPATTVMAAIASSRSSARSEVTDALAGLSAAIGRTVTLLPLGADTAATLAGLPGPVEVAAYLLAEGTFLSELGVAAGGHATVAAPIGAHPAVIELVLARYDSAVGPAS